MIPERGVRISRVRSTDRSMLRLLIRVSLAGAAAGGINAWLCYAGLPRPVFAYSRFAWDIVPAGVLHGGILAVAGCLGTQWNRDTRWPWRLLTAAAVGWLAGYVSWQPLRMSLDGTLAWSSWPFDGGWKEALAGPLLNFGLVAGIFCIARPSDRISGPRRLVVALTAGIAGSLWWWIAYEQWYFSPLHGAIWGSAVGLSIWSRASAAVMLPRRIADVGARSPAQVIAGSAYRTPSAAIPHAHGS
jgi:hypothetical protein